MAWSSGTFTRANGPTGWQDDAAGGIGIEANLHDTQDNDFANGINNCLTKDGQNTPTANLSMGGFKHTNCAAATANNEYATLAQLNSSVGASMPAGAIQMYGGSTAPTGYLLCNGGAVSRASYASLFAVIGTTYGSGDGATTFNVPDLRQKFPLGKAASGTGNALGATGGAIDHDHSVPAHYHGKGTLAIGSSGTHTTSISHNHAAFTSGDDSPDHTHTFTQRDNTTTPLTTGTPASSSGSGTDRQSVATSGTSTRHQHTIDVPNFTGNSSSNGAHSHANGDFSGNVGATGSGTSGDAAMTSGTNNPPFLVVNYIIKT